MVELANANEKYTIEKTSNIFYSHNFEIFENFMEEDNIDTLVENILNHKHIIDDNQDSITITLRKGCRPLSLFCDIYLEVCNFSTLFFGH